MKRSLPAPRQFIVRLAKEPNELKKKLLLLGYLSRRVVDKGGALYLVGGQAVETYTGGVFTTGDIDIATTKADVVEGALQKLSFSKEGMIWLSERLGIAVHIVASYPTRTEKARTIQVDGFTVKVVGVEDLIVDRLAAAKFWKSDRDLEQARALLRTFDRSIDLDYLKKTAKNAGVEDALRRMILKGSRSTHRGLRRRRMILRKEYA